MKTISVKLNLLGFGLRKKIEKLEEIKAATIEQGNAMAKSPAYAQELLQRKQSLITEIESLDRSFESISAEIMPFLQSDSEKYKDLIRQMKEQIRYITELTSEIQELEKRNYIQKKMGAKKEDTGTPLIRLPKAKAAGKYREMKK